MKRLVVSGCGGHAIYHLEVAAAAGFQLVGAYDTDPNKAALLVAQYGNGRAASYASLGAMIATSGADAVLIASPDEDHTAQLREVILTATQFWLKPTILVEKPLTASRTELEDLRHLLGMAHGRLIKVTSCHPRRFDPPYIWTMENLPWLVEWLGKLLHVELDFSYHRSTKPWKQGRDLRLDHFGHEVDFLRVLTRANIQEIWGGTSSPRYYIATGRLTNGITFVCQGSRELQRDAFPEKIALRFARGTCTIDTESGFVVVHDDEGPTPETLPTRVPTDHTFRLLRVMEDLHRLIETGEGELTTEDLMENTRWALP